jgi:hypothetical protein
MERSSIDGMLAPPSDRRLQEDHMADDQGNGGGHRRRRADKPSRLDRAVERGVTRKGCLVQTVGLMGLGLYAVTVVANTVIRVRSNP